jgi:hypothetical protein
MDRRQSRWAVGTSAGAVVSLAVYIVYAVLSPNGARGGSLAGLFFAAMGTGVIVFECLLGLRKRYPASPLGRVKTWLAAHVWLGLLSFLLVLEHSGFHWGHGLAGALMWIFAVILASGIFGVAMQNYIPKRMTELVPRETIYEQIPTVVRGLRVEADERVEFVTADLGIETGVEEEDTEFTRAGGVKQYFDPAQKKGAAEKLQVFIDKRKASPQIEIEESARQAVRAHYLQEIRPFLTDSPAATSLRLLGSRELVAAYFNHLRTIMPVAAHDVLRDLEEISEERRQLLVQRRLHLWMHTWLLVHVPLSFAFLVLTAVHAVLSLRY